LAELDPKLARDFLWTIAMQKVDSHNARALLLRQYASEAFPELLRIGLDANELSKELWSAVTRLIGVPDEYKGAIRGDIIKALIVFHHHDLAADYLLRSREPIPDRWASLFLLARKCQNLSILQYAIAECKSYISSNQLDEREWKDWALALEDFFAEIRKNLLRRADKVECLLKVPANMIHQYVAEHLDIDRSKWGPNDYDDALQEYISFEDTMDRFVDVSLMERARECHRENRKYLSYHSDHELSVFREAIDTLELRQLTLLVKEHKSRGTDPILIEREIQKSLDCLQLTSGNEERYTNQAKSWISCDWLVLEELSRKYLPTAEYIFDKLDEMSDVDYAPFVVEYSRALENEILKKLFEAFGYPLKAGHLYTTIVSRF
jgi:hypothetical protein